MYNKKTWIAKGKPNATPLSDDALNDLESRIENGINNKTLSSKEVWSGEAYEINTTINLNEALEKGKVYCLEFFGNSGSYKVSYTFVYNDNFVQFSYFDPSSDSGFRYRLDVINNGTQMRINADSTNTQKNNRLVKIYKIS